MEHPTLRHATLSDTQEILDMCMVLHKELPVFLKPDLKKTTEAIEKFIIEDKREFILLVSYDEDKLVGVLAAYAFEPLFSKVKIATECLWYLDPKYRGGRRGLDMMDAYEFWAKTVGCKAVQYGEFLQGVKLGSLYKKRGAEPSETVYFKELETE